MAYSYSINRGVKRIRTKTATILAASLLLLPGFAASAVIAGQASAAAPPHANGEITMSSPSQRIKFDTGKDYHTVQYWNYDYSEGSSTLNYTANITCSNVNTGTGEARFEFQIPEGHPGLSGLYVVVYVKSNNNVNDKQYLYGHSSTTDSVTATQWCNSGEGFSPAMYHVDKGVLYVK